jgi:hypothetical protein
MDHGKALLLAGAETDCVVAVTNRHYDNPPSETALLDCITANRLVPCGPCLRRSAKFLQFSPSPGTSFSPLMSPPSSKPNRRGLKLTRDETKLVEVMLLGFRDTLRQSVAGQPRYRHYLEPMYFPSSLISRITKSFFTIQTTDDLASIISSHDTFVPNQCQLLYSKISSTRNSINASRRAVKSARRKEREQRADQGIQIDESEPEIEHPMSSSPVPKAIPTKRILSDATNDPEAKRVRKPRQKQLSVKEVAESYGPPKTRRGNRGRKNDENEVH